MGSRVGVRREADLFEGQHLVGGIVVTAAVSLGLVPLSTGVAVVVLPVVAWACARLGGLDAGLGSVSVGGFMFGWAITRPHFVWEIESGVDQVLLLVLFASSIAAVVWGVRGRRRGAARR